LTNNDEVEEVLQWTGGTTGATNDPSTWLCRLHPTKLILKLMNYLLMRGRGEKSKLEHYDNNSNDPQTIAASKMR